MKKIISHRVLLLTSCSLITSICMGCSPYARNESVPSKTYSLYFHSLNEEEYEPLTITCSNLSDCTLPIPQKEGYSFDGWYLDVSYTIKFSGDQLHEGVNHLYAKYNVNQYNLTVFADEIYTFTFDYKEEIRINIDYGDGYYCNGYYLDEELTNKFTLTKMPAYDVELYPKISFRDHSYTLIFNSETDEQFDSFVGDYEELTNYLLPTPQKDGYEFDDWYLDKNFHKKYDVKRIHEGKNNLYAKFNLTELASQGKEIVHSSNLFDTEHFEEGKGIMPDGRLCDLPGGHTDYIHVKHGEYIVFGDGINGIRYMRYVTAYDSKHHVLPNKGEINGTHIYRVPHGVNYIRVSLYSSNIFEDSRINVSKTLLRYEQYFEEEGPIGENERRKKEYDKKYRPFSTVDADKLDSASYKPLGELNKPYFCLISDDGLKEEATYSIPMAISKGVPMTLGLMIESEILEEPYLTTLRDAVDNHGFEVAQHGWSRYTDFTEDQLNYFFDLEKEYFDSMGFEMKTAICPSHAINKLVSAVASKRFEALRTGYIGNTENYQYGYGWYANGPTSNLYALDCINISLEPLVDHQRHIDDAVANNWLMIGFYHENELNDEKKSKIEAIIDYAKEKGMEFVTLKDVPHLSER